MIDYAKYKRGDELLEHITENQTENRIEAEQAAEVSTESRSQYQKRKREAEKREKRRSRRKAFAAAIVLVILTGVLCGTVIASTLNTPHDAVVIASANAQYVKHTVSDALEKLVDKLPWQQREDDESSELDNMPATDNIDHSDSNTESSQQQGDISEQDQTTTESAVSLETPDNPYGIDPSKPMVALTFDDGPSKYTWPIVSALAQHNARATFFMVGNRVATHEAAIDFLLENDQEVATHSFSHANLVNCGDEELLSQIQKPDKALQKQHDYTPHLFRVPYGERDERVLEALRQQGKPAIGWSVDPRDWEVQDKDAIVKHILARVKDGDIVLMHDLYQPTADAVAELIPALQERGYQLVTVSELFQYKGIELTPGTYYYASWKWV